MLKRRNKKLRPLSLSEQETMKKGSSDDLICPVCWDTETFTQVMKFGTGYKCPVHDNIKRALPMAAIEHSPKYRGVYEQSLIDRRRSNMNKAIQPYRPPPSIAVDEREKDKLVARINQSMVLGGVDLGTYKDAAVSAAADMALVHGLDPFNEELWILAQKKDKKVVGFRLIVGIKGLRRSARRTSFYSLNRDREEVYNGTDNPETIAREGANICPKCSGVSGGKCVECNGTGWWNGVEGRPCFNCGGKRGGDQPGSGEVTCIRCNSSGRITPEGIIIIRVYLDRHDVFKEVISLNEQALKVGMSQKIPYSPIVGEAIWQPGDQVPTRRTPEWVARKNAERDAIVKGFDLSFDLLNMTSVSADEPDFGSLVAEEDIVEAAYTMEDILNHHQEEVAEEMPAPPGEVSEKVFSVDASALSGQEFFDFKKEMQSLDRDALLLLKEVFSGQYNPSNTTGIVAHNLLAMVKAEGSYDKCRELTAKGERWEL